MVGLGKCNNYLLLTQFLGSGIVAAGFGISSSIFAPVQTYFINHENFAATKDG